MNKRTTLIVAMSVLVALVLSAAWAMNASDTYLSVTIPEMTAEKPLFYPDVILEFIEHDYSDPVHDPVEEFKEWKKNWEVGQDIPCAPPAEIDRCTAA